jgi:hypothetical protein
MRESGWWRVKKPVPMLDFLRGRASDRKIRLFVVAVCRRRWDGHPPDELSRTAIEMAERFLEGRATEEDFVAAGCPAGEDLIDVLIAGYEAYPVGILWELSIQADLLRDIFGNPFRRVTVQPSWVQWKDGTVLHLARSIYEDRRFEDLPILADALEEAGCTDLDILGHCRSGGDHVRGCWVVDLVLGKR